MGHDGRLHLRRERRQEVLVLPLVQLAQEVGALLLVSPVVVGGLPPLDVAVVHGVRASNRDGGLWDHRDVVALRGVAALVVRVDGADGVSHRLGGHLRRLRDDDVDVIADADSGVVRGAHAGAKPLPDVRLLLDLLCEDGGEVSTRVGADAFEPGVLGVLHGLRRVVARGLVDDAVVCPVYVECLGVCHRCPFPRRV